jgi:hypothetical protein
VQRLFCSLPPADKPARRNAAKGRRTMRPNTEDSFWSRVQCRPYEECWYWAGTIMADGYGHFCWQGKKILAHRMMYELVNGPIPAGVVVDHLCRNRGCVCPFHLEAVTNKENALRGISFTAINAKKTHCPRGHPYDDVRRWRWCRRCTRRAGLLYYYRHRSRLFPDRIPRKESYETRN